MITKNTTFWWIVLILSVILAFTSFFMALFFRINIKFLLFIIPLVIFISLSVFFKYMINKINREESIHALSLNFNFMDDLDDILEEDAIEIILP